MDKKIRVAVLYGGTSNERTISILSGREVVRGLSKKKYRVVPIEITKDGTWKSRKKKIRVKDIAKTIDAIFIALHGKFGEDGKVQKILDALGVPYTGSGARASTIGFNKVKTLALAKSIGIKTPRYVLLQKLPHVERISIVIKRIGDYPYVIKPNRSGSSVGVSIVRKQRDFPIALRRAFREDDQVIIEEYIKGKELTCGVMGNSGKTRLTALPPVEIIPQEKFFNYRAKYFSKQTQEICPARISKALEKDVQKESMLVHKLLGCDGLTRSDFILKEKTLYFLEINTLPGLTKNSLCPKEAKAAEMSFSEFLDKQVELALKK